MKAETSTVLAEGRYEWAETAPSTAIIEALDALLAGSEDVAVSLMIDSYCVRIEGTRLAIRE